jgi:uncharacterized protein YqjF (DUF2071 family)
MAQRWENLLFAHWPVEENALAPVVPPQLQIDTFDGMAWLAVTPFRVGAHRVLGTPHIPAVTSFPEVNVRTYTTIDGKPGIYFLSLDTVSRLVVGAARHVYRLPYFRSDISVEEGDGRLTFRSNRTSDDGPTAGLDIRYRPMRSPRIASPGSLEHFLTERYCLYTLDDRQRVHRSDIHHPPWPLQDAEAEIRHNSMATGLGLQLDPGGAVLHVSGRQEVLIWPPAMIADAP